MPVGALLLNKDVKVKRSPSILSDSNQSSLSDSRHVSFNQDVSIKRIPKKVAKTKSVDPNDEFHKKCHEFVNVPPPSDQGQIADEAEQILRQLDDIECSVSPTPRITSPVRQLVSPTPRPDSRQGTPGGSKQNTLERRGSNLLGRLSKSSSDLVARSTSRLRAMRVEGTSEQEDSPGPSGGDSRLYGLQALSNLDHAVNGKVNNLYRDSSGSIDYSPPAKKNNLPTPPKPPRKAPSASPPSIRKGYASHDELDYRSRSRAEMYERGDSRNGDYSYTGANPALNHLRQSPSRQSPSRGNHTDSEILSSPTQVLYATISADKHKHSGNLKNQTIQTQTDRQMQTSFRPISADRQMKPSWASSKENILDEPSYQPKNGSNGSSKHASRSLERFVDDDKENTRRSQELKARIHVSSPMRQTSERPATAARKPYKTTINTATDTIQYKGFSSENLVDKNDPKYRHKNLRSHSGKKVDTEHYKVPKNKAPVPAEFMTRKGRTSSENSSAAYNSNYQAPERNAKTQFASTSLVRNAVSENRTKRGEYDREGRRIHSSGRSGERNRAYSGYSTSPDREMSPDRYAKPRTNRVASPRSPSSSPQRPPRSRGSPHREVVVPIRREHSGREVERSPSTRAAATSRSPIKKIQRVHNEIKGDGSQGGREASPHQTRTLTLTRNRGDSAGARGAKTTLVKKENHEDDRLSKFTEYRGGVEEPVAPARSQSGGRRGSSGHELRREHSGSGLEGGRSEGERERGQSVPPGANIDSMRDFYKTNQYRSMYHLPPSPSRPAPVLDRGGGGKTLERPGMRREQTGELVPPPRRHAKTSVSEGELTDDQARAERVQRQRNKFLNNMMNKGEQGQGQTTLGRRVGSTDRENGEAKRVIRAANGEKLNNQRNGSSERNGPTRRPAPQPPMPPTQRVRRSSVEVLETSHSESESPRPEQAKLAADSGRWANGASDIEADYRQQLATNSVHMEARGRSGEAAQVPSIYQQAATLNRKKSGSKTAVDTIARGRSNERSMREVEISQDDDEDEVVRAPTSMSRDEERRKIIELEEERRRKEMKTANVSRSGSRVSKIMGAKLKGSRIAGGGETETDAQSQYSGHSAPNIMKNRYNSNGRVKRTGSSATTSSARQIISRKKMPGSLTSSINSSESENGQSAISRATAASNASNRSVFLHATAVADIPSNKGPEKGAPAPASNLQKSKKISRSISLLAPFKKTTTPKEKEVMYDSSGQVVTGGGKPPRAPPPPIRKLQAGEATMSRDKKFASSSDLLQDENEVVMAYPQQEPAAGPKTSSRVSRSVSMPKDTRLAGWFKKRKRV